MEISVEEFKAVEERFHNVQQIEHYMYMKEYIAQFENDPKAHYVTPHLSIENDSRTFPKEINNG